MRIGAHQLRNALFVAPMAGITDRPFRRLARRYGAALAVSEMLSSRPELRESRKTRLRADHCGEPGPISVQIAGSDPALLAEAARYNVERGADIIDINMGGPKPGGRIGVAASGAARRPGAERGVLGLRGAGGVWVGRGGRGGPWLCGKISFSAEGGGGRAPPPATEMGAILIEHLEGLYT